PPGNLQRGGWWIRRLKRRRLARGRPSEAEVALAVSHPERYFMRLRFRARRRGTTLTLVVPLLFAFFGIAALVIDLGLARVARREMQNAADAVALEGLRGRDDPNVPQANRDQQRRQHASDTVA